MPIHFRVGVGDMLNVEIIKFFVYLYRKVSMSSSFAIFILKGL